MVAKGSIIGARLRREDGASIAEAAIAIPLALVLFFAAMQLGVHIFSAVSLQSQIQSAAVRIDLSEIPEGGSQGARNAAVKEALLTEAVGLDGDCLTVENAKIEIDRRTESAAVEQRGPSPVNRIEVETATAKLTASVTYTIPSVIGTYGIGENALHQDIVAEQTIEQKTEVSHV